MCCISFLLKGDDKSLEKIESYSIHQSLSWVNIAITNVCNFNCRWCYAKSSARNSDFIPLNIYKNILDILKKSGVRQVTLGGGEPLLHPDFIAMAKMSADLGFITNVNTNAYFLDRKLIKILSQNDISQIAIDIESTDEAEHDNVRGKQGSFKRAIYAIEELANINSNVVIQTVLTKNNINSVLDVFRLAKEKNVLKYRVLDLLPVGRAEKLFSEVPKNLNRYMEIICNEAKNLKVKKIISYDPVFPGSKYHGHDITPVHCPSRMGLMGQILTDGTMTYCPSATHIELYNILEHRMISLIHKKAVQDVNNKIHNNCRSCYNYQNCEGGCIARRTPFYTDYSCPMVVHRENHTSRKQKQLQVV